MLGIIGAMEKEIELLRERMIGTQEMKICGMEMYKGQLAGQEAVVARCGWGKVCAAVCATVMINSLGVDRIVNTGVAGGLAEGMKQGDFAVATGFVQHDVDTTSTGDELGAILILGKVVMEADGKLFRALSEKAARFGKVFEGIIATGDQFIADKERVSFIVDKFGAVACDMEGGAIAQVCEMAGVPFAAVRCISDNADGSAGEDFPVFAATAAKKCAEMVFSLIEEGRI